jgi:predicted nucleic acid-binding protein
VIVSAQRSSARTLLSEDRPDGRRIGELVIVNPFALLEAD